MHQRPVRQKVVHVPSRPPSPHIAAFFLCPPHRRQPALLLLQRLPLVCLVLLLLLLSSSHAEDALPPIQHHVYYTGSHVTSIALRTALGELYATDVVHSRIIYYNSSGAVEAVWSVTETPPYSPTSLAYIMDADDGDPRLLYVADSTTPQIVKVNPDNGTQDDSFAFILPSDMWECGVLFADQQADDVSLFVIDRYRGYVAKLLSDQSLQWLTGAPPAAANGSNVTVSYLPALTALTGDGYGGTLYVVDAAVNTVMRMDGGTGSYIHSLALPDFVTGIQAVSWTWCTEIGEQYTGCLWVMYQTGVGDATETGVVAVSVLNGTVVHSWTVQAAAGADSVTAAAGESKQWRRQQASNKDSSAHILSPAMRAIGQGIDSDPFLVYLAEADPSGPGHVIVVRDENGTLVRRYDAIPPQHDLTGYAMHAFSSVQADSSSCTLWLTDVDNGGLLVRAAADGTILQHFRTPALFSAAVMDYSSEPSSPSLVLLSSNATGWQLLRFHPASGVFEQLNTTGVQQQYGSSVPMRNRDADSYRTSDVLKSVDAVVGGLAIDDNGRLAVSLTIANALVLLQSDGQIDMAFDTTDRVTHPTAVTFTKSFTVVVIDRSGSLGEWYIKSFDVESSALVANTTLAPPVSQPLALMCDAAGRLWMADANGLLFQLDSEELIIVPGGIYRPMPAAYSMLSVSMDVYGTVFAVDVATRRLLMLFLDASGRYRPESKPCKAYPVPPSSSSSSSSSSTIFSLSSSSGSTGPAPGGHGGLLSGIDPLTVAAVYVVVVLMLATLVGRHYWLRRRWSSGRREASGSDEEVEVGEDEQAAYEQWVDVDVDEADTSRSPYHRVTDEVVQPGGGEDASGELEAGTGQHSDSVDSSEYELPVDPSDSRYDAYVRLYEALNDVKSDERRWNEATAAARAREESSRPRSRGASSTVSTSGSSRSSSSRSSLSSRPSTPAAFQSSGDSSGSGGSGTGSGSGSGSSDTQATSTTSAHSERALPDLSCIARINSQMSAVPRFIDCVTDLRILGEGVSGRVYRGYYRGMAVVVKLPKSREMSTAQWREWQAHLRLPPHPNLVSFVGSLVMCDTNYLVLRWVEQGSLKSLLSQPSTSSTAGWYTRPYAILRAAVDVAGALHHVHRHGLVHRDVSARNVLVALSGTFVLADLGLCQEAAEAAGAAEVARPTALASVTRALHTATTTVPLRWCSPDVLSTWRFTSASDVWALGVTLWEMASGGRLPYDECVRQSEMQQLLTLHRARLSLDKHWAEHHAHTDERHITAAVERLIDTCMTVDVERRPTAEQVRQQAESELARWEVEEPEAAQRVRRQWEDEHAKAGQAAAEREREREAEVAEREVEVADSTAESVAATAAEAVAAREAVAATAASSGVSHAG